MKEIKCIFCGENLSEKDMKWRDSYICPNCASVFDVRDLEENGEEGVNNNSES